MKRALCLIEIMVLTLGVFFSAYGQNITVTSSVGQNPNTLINNVLAGEGVELSNGKFNNSTGNITYPQIGTFNRGTNTVFPFQSGIVMTTGNVSVAPGPNSGGSVSNPVSNYYTDSQLSSIASSSVNGCAVLDFDFVAYADTFSFNYVFGSEEYPEYVCSNFNDVFAFYLTGLDPVTYTTTTRNVAIIPNSISAAHPTGIPVTINSVNVGQQGSSGGGGTGCYYTYTNYYHDNANGQGGVQYDAYTINLHASAVILACQTYHMHLAVGNVGDNGYDSGVFLEAGSFYSPQLQVANHFNTTQGGDTIIQNCRNVDVEFRLPRANATAYTTSFTFRGDAVLNQDYSFVTSDGDTMTAAQNSFSFQDDTLVGAHISVLPTAHFNQGETKTIILYIETVFCDAFPNAVKRDTLYYYIRANDSIRLQDTTLAYCHQCNQVAVNLLRGTEPLNYEWIPTTGITNPHAQQSAANITQGRIYHVVASDRYGCLTDTATVNITIHEQPEVAFTVTPEFGCSPLQVVLQSNSTPADCNLQWIVTNGNYADTATTATNTLKLDSLGYYDVYLWASTAPGCNDSLTVAQAIHVSDYPHASFTYAPDEPQNGKDVFFYDQSSGANITQFQWNFGDGGVSGEANPTHKYHLRASDNMNVHFAVTNQDGCSDDTTIVVPVLDNYAFWVPNSFTPNNDGVNDLFLPRVRDVAYYQLEIFNRFGELFFSTNNTEDGWDGTLGGKLAPTGVYIWKIQYIKYSDETNKLEQTGTITLIR